MNNILENIPVAEIAIDLDHKVTHWNRAAEILTGRKAADMIGTDRHWEALYRDKRPILADLVMDRRTEEIALL